MYYERWGEEGTVGLDDTEGKDPKRTRMRTLGDDIGFIYYYRLCYMRLVHVL